MKYTKTYDKLKNKKANNFPEWIYIHHTGGTDKYPLADTSHHTAQIIEQWHLSKPGWIGIGYHYVIHKDGEVWAGRPEHVNGAHAIAVNKSSIGICLSGNFDATLPTKEQKSALKSLLLELTEKYDIPKEKVVPHRHTANKTCYGKKLSETWASDMLKKKKVIVNPVAQRVDSVYVPVGTTCDETELIKTKKELKESKSLIAALINILKRLFMKK